MRASSSTTSGCKRGAWRAVGERLRCMLGCSVLCCVAAGTPLLAMAARAQPTTITASLSDAEASAALGHYLYGEQLALAEHDAAQVIAELNQALAQFPETAALYYQRALQYVRLRDWSRAQADVERATQLDPRDVEAHLLLAQLVGMDGQATEATQILEAFLLRRVPESGKVYAVLARMHLQQKAYREAERVLRRMLAQRVDPFTAYYYLGTLYGTHLKQFGRAAQMFQQAIREQPASRQARQALAQLYLDQGRSQPALQAFLALEQYARDDVGVQLRIAVLYYELRQYAAAVERLERVLVQHPHSDKLRYYLGVIYEEWGRFAEAEAAYRAVPESSSYYKDAQLRVALHYVELRKFEAAIATLEHAIRRRGTIQEFYEYLARIHQSELQDAPAAVQVLQRAIRRLPKQAELYLSLGMLYERMKERHKAVRMMRAVLERQPNQVVALNYVGYMYTEWNTKLDEAEGLLQKAVRLQPEDGHIIDSLAWLYFRRGEYARALLLIEQAAERSPREPAILRHWGEILRRLGRTAEARRRWEQGAAIAKQRGETHAEELQQIQKLLDGLAT